MFTMSGYSGNIIKYSSLSSDFFIAIRLPPHLAYDLINDGYIRGLKIGNAFRIPKVNVIEYVMDQGKSAI